MPGTMSPEAAPPEPQALSVIPKPEASSDIPEHPRADEIRRQVEYYFSDANLPSDAYLLEQCNGIENKPVSIKRITAFKKMRCFRPVSQVVQALKRSAFLDVTEDNKGVKRKIPLRPWQLAGGDDDGEDSDIEGAEILPEKALPQPEKKFEPVKSDIPNATKSLLKPNGFEEFYAEAPITPAEYQDDLQLYDPQAPLSERLESAIQRFKLKKKMHQEYARVFNRFMKFGGVECRTQFSGVDKKEIEGKDTYELTRLLATHYVSDDKDDKTRWAIDFEGVAKAFLSSQFQIMYADYTLEEVKRATQVLRTFYNYIMHHNVCPEHTKEILAARTVCDVAEKELLKVQETGFSMPGAFNVACSVLVGGLHKNQYIGNQDWAQGDQIAHPQLFEYVKWTPGQSFSVEEARIVFKAGVMTVGDDDQLDFVLEHDASKIEVKSKEDLGLEVIRIERASEIAFEFCNDHNKKFRHKLPLSPVGKLVCKPWKVPDFEPRDISAAARAKARKNMNRTFEFWIEDELLENCIEGMKMEATIWRLGLGKGIWLLDSVNEVRCSFFKWLPNELLMGDRQNLKEPQYLPYGKGGAPPEDESDKQPAQDDELGKQTAPAPEDGLNNESALEDISSNGPALEDELGNQPAMKLTLGNLPSAARAVELSQLVPDDGWSTQTTPDNDSSYKLALEEESISPPVFKDGMSNQPAPEDEGEKLGSYI